MCPVYKVSAEQRIWFLLTRWIPAVSTRLQKVLHGLVGPALGLALKAQSTVGRTGAHAGASKPGRWQRAVGHEELASLSNRKFLRETPDQKYLPWIKVPEIPLLMLPFMSQMIGFLSFHTIFRWSARTSGKVQYQQPKWGQTGGAGETVQARREG